jgi:rhamnogalacturonyl hydrolase YesR
MGGDPAWFDIAAHQFPSHAAVLKHPDGLWGLGRGWVADAAAPSPGGWSRGHGWLLRGLSETLHWLPRMHPRRAELQALLVETVQTLAPLQDDEGMWHVLLHRPCVESAPETSGTGLMAHAIALAVAGGDLPAQPWTDIARRAIAAVCRQVGPGGAVAGACVTPGLLLDDSEELYLHKSPPPDDHHGLPAVLYACLGERLLEGAAAAS